MKPTDPTPPAKKPHQVTYQIPAGECDTSMGAIGFRVACKGTPDCGRDPARCKSAQYTRVIKVTSTGPKTRPTVEVSRW